MRQGGTRDLGRVPQPDPAKAKAVRDELCHCVINERAAA